ncbi:MAG: ribonuclease P protein component [Puniceicoccales bacterium]|jgi:ribonuclease P protein component|nr:ribonuclease P protein component [Puniceicoccales bacterium]
MFRLLRSQRISDRPDFELFRASSQRCRADGYLLVQKLNRDSGALPRIALVASRKVGNAVRRNKLRRVFREHFRHCAATPLKGNDFLVVFLAESKKLNPQDMGKEFARRLKPMNGYMGKAICDRP